MGKDGMQSVSKKPWSGKSLAIPTTPRKVPLIPSEDKKGLRGVDGTGLENRRCASIRGFESYSPRQTSFHKDR